MITAMIAALGACGVFGLFARRAACELPPRLALWILTVGGLIAAAASSFVLGSIVATLVGQWDPIAKYGDWSPDRIEEVSPVPAAVAVLAAIALGAALLSLMRALARSGRQIINAWITARRTPHSLVVLNDDAPFAYAVPGWPGRVVASQGLLTLLDAQERRALLAHEQAHLDQRHDLHLFVAIVAAAVNPLFLARVPAAVRLACERAADDKAALAVGSRKAVAVAIVRAASPAQSAAMLFGAGGSDTVARVQALLADRGFHGRTALVVTTAMTVLAAVAVAWIYQDLDHIFDAAAWQS